MNLSCFLNKQAFISATTIYFWLPIHCPLLFTMRKHLLLLASATFLPFVSVAQNGPTSVRAYVGVGANLLTDTSFKTGISPKLVGPALTIGLQVIPRLAIQTGIAYNWTKHSDTSPSYTYINQGGQSMTFGGYTTTFNYKYFTIPIVLRYTFAPSAERFHVDGLAGITLLHFSSYYESNYPSVRYETSDERRSSSTQKSLTLGPAVRYSVAPHVELTANGLVSAVLGNRYNSFSDRLFLNVLVGAQYTFGAR